MYDRMKLMFNDVNYKKGGNEGKISYFPQQEKPFLAVTAIESNWYKTQLGAEKFMSKRGYKRTEN
jgi:hypothetical protein